MPTVNILCVLVFARHGAARLSGLQRLQQRTIARLARQNPERVELDQAGQPARRGELLLQKDNATGKCYFPPRPFCPSCASRKVSTFKASGKGFLYSYVINHRPAAPGFTPGMNAPCFFRFSARSMGLKMMAV